MKYIALLLLPALLVFSGCKSIVASRASRFSHFTALTDFSNFTRSAGENGQTVLLSPEIQSPVAWNELIVSWNADAPTNTGLTVEAAAISGERHTKYYTLGKWSTGGQQFPRTSVKGQRDADGTVATDTLMLKQAAQAVQIRVTLAGANGALPTLKFLGLSFANTAIQPTSRPPNQAAWGKIIETPERSQHGYPGEHGWCSPTSMSMVLARWADRLGRPEMNLTVPQVAAAVYDRQFAGTGNWPFNTAFAGSFTGMRSYVTRFDDLSEVEDWIAAGIPVVLSTRWDQLKPGRPLDPDGHLVVCIGFTKDGDPVINDPATRLDRGEKVRRVYLRRDVINSWSQSHHAVYLVYPENAAIPANRYGHWE